MSSMAMGLVRAIEANGGHATVDGEHLAIAPEDAAMSVIEELRRNCENRILCRTIIGPWEHFNGLDKIQIRFVD